MNNGVASDVLLKAVHVDSAGDGLPDFWKTKGIDLLGDGSDLFKLSNPSSKDPLSPHQKYLLLTIAQMSCGSGICPPFNMSLSPAAVEQMAHVFEGHHITVLTEFHTLPPADYAQCLRVSSDTAATGAGCNNGVTTMDRLESEGLFTAKAQRDDPVLNAEKRLAFRFVASADQPIIGNAATTNGGVTPTAEDAADTNCTTVQAASVTTGPACYWWGSERLALTLGRWTGASVPVQAGDLMHELGHSLGLHHGGTDDANCKPNYQSVMNYNYIFPSTPICTRTLSEPRTARFSTTAMEPTRRSHRTVHTSRRL